MKQTHSSIIFLAMFLMLCVNIIAQKIDTNDYYKGKIIPDNKLLHNILKPTKEQKWNLFDNIAISPLKDKIVLVSPSINMISADLREPFILWLVDLKTERTIILAKSEDKDLGIHQPSWSPDGIWISFATFSIGGHSPTTDGQTWVIDSSGSRMCRINLPGIFGKFRSSVIKWETEHVVIIQGTALKQQNGKWTDINVKFSYDCETQVLKPYK
jgi:dipeptidyl aminopeptidase/acylaminoacyl peptidase